MWGCTRNKNDSENLVFGPICCLIVTADASFSAVNFWACLRTSPHITKYWYNDHLSRNYRVCYKRVRLYSEALCECIKSRNTSLCLLNVRTNWHRRLYSGIVERLMQCRWQWLACTMTNTDWQQELQTLRMWYHYSWVLLSRCSADTAVSHWPFIAININYFIWGPPPSLLG